MANTILKIYEIQNIGKGIISTLLPENLLLLNPNIITPGIQDVLSVQQPITLANSVPIFDGHFSIFGIDGNGGYIHISKDTGDDAPFPTSAFGICDEYAFILNGLQFYKDKTVLIDLLNGKGIEYAGNYEGNFTARSLVTKQWVESVVDENLQKVINYPADFIGTNYTLTNADNKYTIFINNATTAVTITRDAGITLPNFCVGFIQKGSADVTFVGVTNPIGLKSKGQGFQTFIERELSTSNHYLLGNTKA